MTLYILTELIDELKAAQNRTGDFFISDEEIKILLDDLTKYGEEEVRS